VNRPAPSVTNPATTLAPGATTTRTGRQRGSSITAAQARCPDDGCDGLIALAKVPDWFQADGLVVLAEGESVVYCSHGHRSVYVSPVWDLGLTEQLEKLERQGRTCLWPSCGHEASNRQGLGIHMQRVHKMPTARELGVQQAQQRQMATAPVGGPAEAEAPGNVDVGADGA
jgi:hypothetical protein